MKVIVLLNSYTSGKSGGDVCCIESVKRFKNCDVTVITSQLGKKLCEDLGLKAKFLLTTQEKSFGNIYVIYVTRIFWGILVVILNLLNGFQDLIVKRCRNEFGMTQSRSPIKSGTTEVVYISSDALPDILPALFMKLFNPKIIWLPKIYHLIPKERGLPFFLQKIAFKIIKKFRQIIIVDNSKLKDELVKLNFSTNSIHVNYPGIDTEGLKKIPIKKIAYQGVYLGRIHKTKGVFDLPIIWKKVVEKIPNIKLAIIGTGDKQAVESLKLKVKSFNLNSNIDILGFLSDKNAYAVVKNSKVLLFPSYEEGFGMVVAESLCLGTPVVNYNLKNLEFFKTSVNRVETGNTENFAAKVIQILNRTKQKPDINNFIKNLSWEKYSEFEQRLIYQICHFERGGTRRYPPEWRNLPINLEDPSIALGMTNEESKIVCKS